MRWLKILLALNGVAFAFYGVSNIAMPTSYFLTADAAANAIDAVRVVGVLYLGLAVVQLGAWFLADRTAVRLVAVASIVPVAGFAAVAALQTAGSTDTFHQLGMVGVIGNAVVAVLYLFLLYRERATAA